MTAKRRDELTALPNIGVKLAAMLRAAGIRTKNDIRHIGAAAIYRRLQATSEKHLPVCYYLYSLEGAVRGVHWNVLTDREKHALRRDAGLPR